MMKASVCRVSFWKHFKCVAESRLFCVIRYLRGNCTAWCAIHPNNCIRVPPKGVSEIVVYSHFAIGFILVSILVLHVHATPPSHRSLMHAGINGSFFSANSIQFTKVFFFAKSAARSIRQSFFRQLSSKVHSPKFSSIRYVVPLEY